MCLWGAGGGDLHVVNPVVIFCMRTHDREQILAITCHKFINNFLFYASTLTRLA